MEFSKSVRPLVFALTMAMAPTHAMDMDPSPVHGLRARVCCEDCCCAVSRLACITCLYFAGCGCVSSFTKPHAYTAVPIAVCSTTAIGCGSLACFLGKRVMSKRAAFVQKALMPIRSCLGGVEAELDEGEIASEGLEAILARLQTARGAADKLYAHALCCQDGDKSAVRCARDRIIHLQGYVESWQDSLPCNQESPQEESSCRKRVEASSDLRRRASEPALATME